MSEQELKGRTALVTGASRGIGWAIAAELARRGARVIGTATQASGAQTLQERLREWQPDAEGRVLDVADPARCAAVVEAIGGIDILINNAAVTRDNLLLRMSDADFEAVLATNLTSVARLSRLVLRGMMKQRRGRIISISSVVGSTGNGGQTNYAAAKAGLLGFSRSLAREIASRGITVNVVAPGFIDTDMTRGLSDDIRAGLLNQIPLGRLGSPEDVAATVAFLASDAAAYITGQTLHVNGGMYMG